MEENKIEPLKMSIDEVAKTISVSKGYAASIVLTMDDCHIIGIVYEKILKDMEGK